MPSTLLPYGLVRVAGPSMVPTLRDGDRLIVRYGAPVRPGDVVVAYRPDLPGLVIVKRAVRCVDDGWWLRGDNPYGSDDSAAFGAVPARLVLARALLRLRRGGPGPLRRVSALAPPDAGPAD